VDIQEKFIHCLNDAIELKSVWDDDVQTAAGFGDWVTKEQHSYPFTVVAFGPGTEGARKALGY
jgi:hypothetical protein